MNKKIKKLIEDNYKIKINEINEDTFYYNNEKILIYITEENEEKIKEIFELSNYLYYCRIKNNTFLFNKKEKIITSFETKKLILMKINDREENINITDIKKININSKIEKIDIKNKWEKEVDKYEKMNNEKITYLDNYYIGMAENAIQLIQNYNGKNEELCHDLKINEYNKKKFNNPFSYINTNYLYDVSNYIKYKYIKEEIKENEIEKIIDNINNIDDKIFFFASLLYPNYYFDNYEKYNKNLIKKYERILLECKNKLNIENINNIEWIK